MKKNGFLILCSLLLCPLMFFACTTEQLQSGMEVLGEATQNTGSGDPSSSRIASGLKAALDKGANSAGKQLSLKNGFFKNQAVKILFPAEFINAEKKLRSLGMGKLADQAIVSFNRAAESASKKAYPILASAITQMTIQDAMNILMGPNNAATSYLKKTTSSQLNAIFLPIVKKSADSVNATKYWNDLASTYNKIPFVKPVPNNINKYITKRTVSGLFFVVEKKEADIRENPVERTTELLKDVFGFADNKK